MFSGVDLIIDHHQHASSTTLRIQRHLHRRQQIGRAIGAGLAGRTHGAGQDQWRVKGPEQFEKVRHFLQGICALGQHHSVCALFHLGFGPVQDIDQLNERQRCTGQHLQGFRRDARKACKLRRVGQHLRAVQAWSDTSACCCLEHAEGTAEGSYG
ncbi:hypothetical protein D3C79_618270 [compost metagenome]